MEFQRGTARRSCQFQCNPGLSNACVHGRLLETDRNSIILQLNIYCLRKGIEFPELYAPLLSEPGFLPQ